MPTTTIDFDEETALGLQRLADDQGCNLAEIIRAALADYLRRATQDAFFANVPPAIDANSLSPVVLAPGPDEWTEAEFAELSMQSALRGLEDEPDIYTLEDLKERWL